MHSVRLLLLIVVLLCLSAPPARASGGEVIVSRVAVCTPAFEVTEAGVVVSGYAADNTPGAPQLPVYGTLVELPAGGRWELSFVTRGSRILNERISVRAAPVPAAIQRGAAGGPDGSLATVEDRPDPAIYGRNAFYPESPVAAGAEQWQRGRRLLAVRVFPFQYNPITREVLYHAEIEVTVRVAQPAVSSQPSAVSDQRSAASDRQPAAGAPAAVTSALGGARIRTNQHGMHRLTYGELEAAGVPVAGADPAGFAMSYLGQPIRIQVIGGEDGSFDPPDPVDPDDPGDLVLFYAVPYTGRWMPTNVYQFTYSDLAAGPETRMATRTVEPTGEEPVITTVTQAVRIDRNVGGYFSYYWIDTEADHFFDAVLSASTTTQVVTRTYDLVLDDPITDTISLTLQGLLYGAYDPATLGMSPRQWAQLKLNEHEVGEWAWDGRSPQAIPPTALPAGWLDRPTNQIHLVADFSRVPAGYGSYKYNPDFIELAYPARADAELDRINISELRGAFSTSALVEVTGFTTDQVRVYDVRIPAEPVQLLNTSATLTGGAYTVSFPDAWGESDPAPAYWLSTEAALLAPAAVEADELTSWKSPDHTADYITVVHRSLWDAVQPLLDRRAAGGLAVAKVDVQDIYDEFNGGHLHQNAIRDFLHYAYDNWNADGARPRYVLLAGDGTFDFKGAISTSLKNLVPPFLGNFDPFIVETASDNRFVTFDGPDDLLAEMTIGRIPAQNTTEMATYLAKVAAYEDRSITPDGAWQESVVYTADTEETSAGDFHSMSDDVRDHWLPADYDSSTIYFNPNNDPAGVGYETPAAFKAALKQAFNDGAAYLQFLGHASRYRWGSVTGMWNIFDVPALNANTRLPFVAAFSCWEGYFIDVSSGNYPSLAERHVLQPGRGAIAALGPSGQHVGSALLVLDQGLTKSIFQDRIAAVGDAVDATKSYYLANGGSFLDVVDTSILLGDPALELRLPPQPPVAPAVGIAFGTASTIDLSWLHLAPDASYQVWRGAAPYFDPDTEGVQVGTVDAVLERYAAGDPAGFNDDGLTGPAQVVGDVAANYTWIVRGANGLGVSGNSNRVGEFDFALVPGE